MADLTMDEIEEFRAACERSELLPAPFSTKAVPDYNVVCDMAEAYRRAQTAEPVAYQGWNPRTGAVEFSADRPVASVIRDFNMRPLYAAPPRQVSERNAALEEAVKVCKAAADQSEQTFGHLSTRLEQAVCKGAVAQARKLQHAISALAESGQREDAVVVPRAEVTRMVKALDAIYNHNEATRAAVIQHYGLHHHPAMLAAHKGEGNV